MVGLVSYTVLIYEHIITFDDEVELVWKRKKGPIIYLFLMLRYLVPIAFIVNLYAYFSPVWSPVMCAHFVRYEGVMHAFEIYIVGLMMMLRVKALYPGNKWIPWLLSFYVAIEASVTSYLLVHGIPVIHNPSSGVEACTMIFDETISDVASSSFAWLPLLYDSVILGMTLNRTIPATRGHRAGVLIKQIFRDGILYFVVIFGLAFTLTFMIIFAPAGIKNISAQMEQLITVAMMSRITLNLKKAGTQKTTIAINSHGFEEIPLSTFGGLTTRAGQWLAGVRSTVQDNTVSDSIIMPEGQKIRRPIPGMKNVKY